MMATLDDRGEVRPVRLWAAVLRVVLSVLLALAALYGLVRVDGVIEALVALGHLWGPWAPQTTYLLAKHLLILLGGIGAILWLRPWQAVIAVGDFRDDEGNPATLDTAVMSAVLGLVALAGLSASAGVVGAVLFDPRIEHPVNWLTWAHLATLLLIAAGGIWGLARLKPWAGRETVSPATRKTNALFGIGGILATISCLAVVFDTIGRDGDPFGVWSNGPVTLTCEIIGSPFMFCRS